MDAEADARPLPSERTLERIRKMLALADGQANPNESATAAAMAERLMAKYGLDRETVLSDAPFERAVGGEAAADDWDEPAPAYERAPEAPVAPARWPYVAGFGALAAALVVGAVLVVGGQLGGLSRQGGEDPTLRAALAGLLGRLDGTSEGALRAAREFRPTPLASRPTREEIDTFLATANNLLPRQVDEVTWINRVRVFDDSIIYEFEVKDARTAALMRGLAPADLKALIAQSAAQGGTDVCQPIRESNRHYRITSEYLDSNARPINAFSYERGECLAVP